MPRWVWMTRAHRVNVPQPGPGRRSPGPATESPRDTPIPVTRFPWGIIMYVPALRVAATGGAALPHLRKRTYPAVSWARPPPFRP